MYSQAIAELLVCILIIYGPLICLDNELYMCKSRSIFFDLLYGIVREVDRARAPDNALI